MPYHRPISPGPPGPPSQDDKSSTGSSSRRTPGLKSLVQAEKLMQIAFVLPCAMVFGWGVGWCFDHFLHTRWGTVVGLILGIIAGMVSVIRMAMEAMQSLSGRDRS